MPTIDYDPNIRDYKITTNTNSTDNEWMMINPSWHWDNHTVTYSDFPGINAEAEALKEVIKLLSSQMKIMSQDVEKLKQYQMLLEIYEQYQATGRLLFGADWEKIQESLK